MKEGSFLKREKKPGEIKFVEKFEQIHREKPEFFERKPEERVKLTLEAIRREVEESKEIKREKTFHPSVPIQQTINILSQAIQIVIEEGVDKALEYIKKFNDPYLLDAFHDLLVGHFLNVLKEQNKI